MREGKRERGVRRGGRTLRKENKEEGDVEKGRVERQGLKLRQRVARKVIACQKSNRAS